MARKKVSRSSLVRAALGAGITKPSEIVNQIKKEHGVVVKAAWSTTSRAR
jgi:hypothetical protein